MNLEYGPGILSAVVVAAALRVETDKKVGWHKSISNIPVTGPTGISQPITWDLEDMDTDASYLNQHEITTLIQHQGFRFWGNRTCSSDPNFAFEVATRTAHFLLDTIINGCFPFVDQPLTPYLAKDIIDSIDFELQEHVQAKRLLGAKVWYDPNENSVGNLQQGKMWIDYDYTPVPPLENLNLNQRITGRYLVDFAQLINGANATEGV
ncbi:phage tail sheath subtilisin-like domain-containing protein [Acinetobacter sp. WZC-1]|uniref:phage tail sheath subtilisin-like domain-containing protein n=1 Tax=Acinetobacter sp. WZC-1 TaxID=3459034 RepID=UPI00403DD0F5